MQKLEKEVYHRYHSTLRGLGVSDAVMTHYVKWVRYFSDYGGKYGDGSQRVELIDGFVEKLASKGQSGGLCEQARRAVEVFLGMGAGEVVAGVAEQGSDYAGVFMPDSLGSRRAHKEAKEYHWQWLFPAKELTLLPEEGIYRR